MKLLWMTAYLTTFACAIYWKRRARRTVIVALQRIGRIEYGEVNLRDKYPFLVVDVARQKELEERYIKENT